MIVWTLSLSLRTCKALGYEDCHSSSVLGRQSHVPSHTPHHTISMILTSVFLTPSFLPVSHWSFLSSWTGVWRLCKYTAGHEKTLIHFLWVCYAFTAFIWQHDFYLQVKASHFDGLITTILGYILLAGALIVCHVSSALLMCMELHHNVTRLVVVLE